MRLRRSSSTRRGDLQVLQHKNADKENPACERVSWAKVKRVSGQDGPEEDAEEKAAGGPKVLKMIVKAVLSDKEAKTVQRPRK